MLDNQRLQQKIRPMTLEGCLVRICDVIAYIGRDIEDAIVVKLIKRKDIPAEITSVLEILIGVLLIHLYEI